MVFCSDYYTQMAQELHERERSIKAARGEIIDATGAVLASNKTVCTISVIHNQVTDKEAVIDMLCKELSLSEEYVRKRVEKYTSIERIKSNVAKETGDIIRKYDMDGVKVDEDFKRYYPYGELGSKVLGFTGGDNQGIVGLEVMYEEYLKGTDGMILTVTDAKGIEVEEAGENRIESINGNNLHISMDINIQSYATQLAKQVMETKQADGVSILVMNPQNGEILAMVDVPEFDLNEPFIITEAELAKTQRESEEKRQKLLEKYTASEDEETLQTELQKLIDINHLSESDKQVLLNDMWRNSCINDTYEPGSTFKIITSAAGLEQGVVKVEDTFQCPGYITVEDRRIRCHKTTGHGSETFLDGIMNSCNPVFITVGLRLGIDDYYKYFKQFGLLEKTNIDLPGEAGTIMHQKKDMGLVELATVSFGQSFQITPIQLATTASSIVNGGNRITPHFAVSVKEGEVVRETFQYPVQEGIVSEETSETMRYLLEQVVAEGTGKNGYVEGFRVGGKTATSQTLPRGSGKYIASFIGFAPADNPKVLALAIIHNPKGVYYGGQIAAPVVRQLFENILPYLERIDYNNSMYG